jgi:hypothetical protein
VRTPATISFNLAFSIGPWVRFPAGAELLESDRVAGMSITHDDVLRAALQLPERERMLLAEELIESVPENEGPAEWNEPELLAVLSAVTAETLNWRPTHPAPAC